jgi:hypothetical protein
MSTSSPAVPRPAGGTPVSLVLARLMLCGQVVMWSFLSGMDLLVLVERFVAPVDGMVSLGRMLLQFAGATAAATGGALLAFRLGRLRVAWFGALAYHGLLTALYAWFFHDMAVEPAPEGMASFVAVVLGVPIVAASAGSTLFMLWPGLIRHCFRPCGGGAGTAPAPHPA